MAEFAQFFIPAVRLTTGQAIVENLDGQGLTMEWTITRDNTNKADEAEINIYNLSPSVSGKIFEAWQVFSAASGYLVTFAVGWEGVPKLAIMGDVYSMSPDEKTATDVMTTLKIGDGHKALQDSKVGKSFVKVKIDTVLDYLVQFPVESSDAGGGGLGLVYPPESRKLVVKAASELPVQTWGNIPAGANTRDAVNIVMSTLGLEWRVHNGEFIVLRGGTNQRPPFILSPSTGLLTYSRRDDSGANLTALANAEIEPGSQVIVQGDDGKPFGAGVFRVDKTVLSGSTKSASTMKIVASKALVG